jgi:hypothetical protein
VEDDAASVAAMPWLAPGSQEIGADDKPLEAMDIGSETLPSKLTIKERLNQRSTPIHPPLTFEAGPNVISMSMNDFIEELSPTATAATTSAGPPEASPSTSAAAQSTPEVDQAAAADPATPKTAKVANLKSLGTIPKLPAQAKGSSSQGNPSPGPSTTPAGSGTASQSTIPPPPAAASAPDSRRNTTSGEPRPKRQQQQHSVRGGASTSKGTKRQYPQSPSSSTSPASYMAVASTPRNYLIHVYRVRDNLVPFDCEEEFCTFPDTLKAAIWAESAQHGIDRE